MKKIRPKSTCSRVFNAATGLMVLLASACAPAGPRWLSARESGPADAGLLAAVSQPDSGLSVRGRLSSGLYRNLPFRLAARGDTLDLSVRSRLGTEAARMLVLPDSVFMLDAVAGELTIAPVSAAPGDPVLAALLAWKPLLFNRPPGPARERRTATFIQWDFENGERWLIRRSDSALVRRALPSGLRLDVEKNDPVSRRPLAFRVTAPSLEMPIFVTVTAYSAAPATAFRTKFPPGVRIRRP